MIICIDGAFVKGRPPTDRASLEIITGLIEADAEQSKVFAVVRDQNGPCQATRSRDNTTKGTRSGDQDTRRLGWRGWHEVDSGQVVQCERTAHPGLVSQLARRFEGSEKALSIFLMSRISNIGCQDTGST